MVAAGIALAANHDVERFLAGQIRFTDIAASVEDALRRADFAAPHSIADVLEIDRTVRRRVEAQMKAACH